MSKGWSYKLCERRGTTWFAADAFGTSDSDVLARSVKECRILVTNDKDFAELAFLQRSAANGIVLIRLPHSSSRDKAAQIEAVVADLGGRLTGAMTVVEADATRRRPLPPPFSARTRRPE